MEDFEGKDEEAVLVVDWKPSAEGLKEWENQATNELDKLVAECLPSTSLFQSQ